MLLENQLQITLTGCNGNYGFQLLNPMQYYVTFTFNGMQFSKTDIGC